MARWRPDPTFYPSPRLAAEGPREELAYVATLDANGRERPDAMSVIDLKPESDLYGQVVHTLEMPTPGDELHHFNWNACSAALCPWAPQPHVERRYLVVPALKSSNIHIIDTKDDPVRPKIVRTIDAAELARRAGYSRPHTVHCGPKGIYVSALGGANGNEGPGGIFLLDCDSFDVLGQWEVDRGPQVLGYDFWWHLGHDTLVSSEWALPRLFEDGIDPNALLAREYGHAMHIWDLRSRKHRKALELGDAHQMVLEMRPAHDPRQAYGFVGVVTNVEDLSASIWLWHRDNGDWEIEKVIEIPAEPAAAEELPEIIRPFGAVPPLVTDISLSLDDRFLVVSCWGTGELRRYDVSNPRQPRLTGSVHLGGIVRRTPHPASGPVNGGPQMVETSRDGQRIYLTNSLYSAWDEQFYPEGMGGWMVKIDAPDDGSLHLDPDFYVDDWDGRRPHQVRLQGGDASSDSYCFP